jgi:rod shape-determining protein MreD
MRELLAIPVLILAVVLQSSIVSRIPLLSGVADLPLVMLAAWALQESADTTWHWAIAVGLLVGFVSGVPFLIPLIAYLVVVLAAFLLRQRVWQTPLLAMYVVTFLGTLVFHLLTLGALRLTGISLPVLDVLGLLTLPSILLNLLLATPMYAVMRDFARWMYPARELE